MAASRAAARRSSGRRRKAKEAAPQRDSFWSRLSPRKQHAVCIVLLLVAGVAFFLPYHLDGLSFVGHDVVQWRAGAESIIEDRERFDEEPLWATNMFSGMPATVISHARQFPGLDRLVLDPLGFMYPIAEYWLMLIGGYLLFALLGFRPLTSAIGALTTGFTTYIPIIVAAGHHTKFVAYAFMPWIAAGYAMVTRHAKWHWIGFAVFLLALSLHLRQSHPQVTYYFFYLLAAWFVLDLVRAFRRREARPMLQSTGLLVLAAVIAVLTVVQPLWAMLEYSPHSIRGSSGVETSTGLDIDYAFVWSQGWGELVTLAVPDAYGGADAYWGPKPVTSGPHYFGAIALLLFVIGLIRGRHELKWLFFGVGIATLLFSLGKHFPALNETMFAVVPGFDKFRTPEMWLIVTVFGFTLVALTGVEWIVDRAHEVGGKVTLRELYVPLGIVGVFSLVMAMGASSMLSFERPGEVEMIARQLSQQAQVPMDDPRVVQTAEQYVQTELVPTRADMATSDSMRLLLFVALAAGVLVAAVLGKVPMAVAGFGLVLLTAVDLLTVGSRYINEQALMPRSVDAVDAIERQKRPLDAWLEENVQTGDGWSYRVLPVLDNPFNNAIPAYFYPSLGGYTGAKVGRYQDLIDHALFTDPYGINTGVLSMLNARYVSHSAQLPLPGFRVAYQGDDGVVNENLNVLPKAFFVDSLVTASTAQEALAFISETFDPAAVAVVEADRPIDVAADPQADARVTRYEPRRIELEVARNTPGFLVLSEVYYEPGWRAFVDGAQTPIIRTNYVLRGVEVPAGASNIRFEYDPPSYTIGRPVTTAANIVMWILVIGAVGGTVRRRRES